MGIFDSWFGYGDSPSNSIAQNQFSSPTNSLIQGAIQGGENGQADNQYWSPARRAAMAGGLDDLIKAFQARPMQQTQMPMPQAQMLSPITWQRPQMPQGQVDFARGPSQGGWGGY